LASSSAGANLAQSRNFFCYVLHAKPKSNLGVRASCYSLNPRMAQSMRSLWLACWTIPHNARPRASLLRPGTECWIVVSLCWLLATLEQSTNFRIAADNVHGYSTDLATRVFRSPLAFRGKLRPEMELCARKSSSGATDAKCGRMAVSGRNRSAFVVAADAVRGFKD